MKTHIVVRAVLAVAAMAALPVSGQEAGQDIKQLRLGDWKPRSMLVTKVTKVDQPAFPVIDVHNPYSCIKSRPQALISAKRSEVSHCFQICPRRRQTERTVESVSDPVLCRECWFSRLRSRGIDSIYATMGSTRRR